VTTLLGDELLLRTRVIFISAICNQPLINLPRMNAFAVVDEADVILEEIVVNAQLNGQPVGAIVIPPDLNG
jgi:hypothetical protein